MSDDEFGSAFLQHSDPTLRDQDAWQAVSDIKHTERAHRVLKTMQHVNMLALLAKKEALETFKAGRLELFHTSANPGLTLSQDPEWLEERSRFEKWHCRSKRFAQRVNTALDMVRDIRRAAGYHDPIGGLWTLIDAINDYLDERTEEADLEAVADRVARSAYRATDYARPVRVWAVCEVSADGSTLLPRWNEWFDDRDQAAKSVHDAPGTVLGTALVSGWSRTGRE
jgi:hypothetical protein